MGGGRAPCCDKSKVKRGPWSPAEDSTLVNFVGKHGCSNWRALPKQAGLLRCGKSCRLRWINYLRPDVKRGNFTPEEEQTIINLHNSFGNKWSKIASCLPGRTDNEIKNVWNTHLKKRLTKNVAKNCRKNGGEDSKTNHSGSPSSSSITTLEDQKTEMKPGDGTVQESRIQKPEPLNVKATHLSDGESKETASSESPVYFHASNFSNSNQVNASGSNQEPIVNQGNGPDHGNGAIQFESDIDFWELLDSLDPSQFTQTEQNGVNVDFSLFNPAETFGSEVECNKWLTLLENELGLTSDNFPKDQEMNFEPEFSPAVDYFPIWNCLP